MSQISLYVWGLGFGVWGCGWWVGGLYVHTIVKNLLIKFLMMLLLVAKGCKFDSCELSHVGVGCVDNSKTAQPYLSLTDQSGEQPNIL